MKSFFNSNIFSCNKCISRTYLFIIAALFNNSINTFAQEPSSYKLEFLSTGRKNPEKPNYLVAIFRIIPVKSNFKLVMSMRVTYRLGKDGSDIIVDITKQSTPKIRIGVYGRDIKEKNQSLYDLIKDKYYI